MHRLQALSDDFAGQERTLADRAAQLNRDAADVARAEAAIAQERAALAAQVRSSVRGEREGEGGMLYLHFAGTHDHVAQHLVCCHPPAQAEALQEERAVVKRSVREMKEEAARHAKERQRELLDWQARLSKQQGELDQERSSMQVGFLWAGEQVRGPQNGLCHHRY